MMSDSSESVDWDAVARRNLDAHTKRVAEKLETVHAAEPPRGSAEAAVEEAIRVEGPYRPDEHVDTAAEMFAGWSSSSADGEQSGGEGDANRRKPQAHDSAEEAAVKPLEVVNEQAAKPSDGGGNSELAATAPVATAQVARFMREIVLQPPEKVAARVPQMSTTELDAAIAQCLAAAGALPGLFAERDRRRFGS